MKSVYATSLIAIPLLAACGATPLMQTWIDFNYAYSRGNWPPLYAGGFLKGGDSNNDAVIVEFTAWLEHVPEFVLVFPDGFKVNSRGITSIVLRDHGPSLGRQRSFVGPSPTRIGWTSSAGISVTFEIHDDKASIIEVCTPAYYSASSSKELSFETLDGGQVDLPLPYKGFTRLFGEPTFADRQYLLAKWQC